MLAYTHTVLSVSICTRMTQYVGECTIHKTAAHTVAAFHVNLHCKLNHVEPKLRH
jgi:hypothetical protein